MYRGMVIGTCVFVLFFFSLGILPEVVTYPFFFVRYRKRHSEMKKEGVQVGIMVPSLKYKGRVGTNPITCGWHPRNTSQQCNERRFACKVSFVSSRMTHKP